MDKYLLRFFFEHGGGCLWSGDKVTKEKFGYLVNPESLPLSTPTKKWIKQLEHQFEGSIDWDDPAGPSPWTHQEWQSFITECDKLLAIIEKELGETFYVINKIT